VIADPAEGTGESGMKVIRSSTHDLLSGDMLRLVKNTYLLGSASDFSKAALLRKLESVCGALSQK
jgi:hypothetical protein